MQKITSVSQVLLKYLRTNDDDKKP